jgi:hypothetical protein
MEYVVDSLITKCGDVITFYITIVNNKPWFRIVQDSQYTSSSYYDGDSLERAKQIYCDLLLVFQGIKSMENFSKKDLTNEVNKVCQENNNKREFNFNELKRDPLFLGINDFG